MNAEEMKKAIVTAVASFSGEKKKASFALKEVERLKAKVPDLERRITENQAEIVHLRAEISQGVADGKSMSKEIEQSATLKGQNEVLSELVEDLQETQIPAAEQAAREALDDYHVKISQAIQAVKKEQQKRFAELVKTMAESIIAWDTALASFSKDSGALVSGKFNSLAHATGAMLRFPDISVDDRPERILVRIERGEI